MTARHAAPLPLLSPPDNYLAANALVLASCPWEDDCSDLGAQPLCIHRRAQLAEAQVHAALALVPAPVYSRAADIDQQNRDRAAALAGGAQ